MARFPNRPVVLSCAIASLLCTACATPSSSNATVVLPESNLSSGVMVGLGPCVTTATRGRGILDSVMAAVVSKGVNLLGTALTQAGEAKTLTAIGSRNLPGGKAFPACVQVVRGRFNTDKPAAPAPWLSQLTSVAGAHEQLTKNGIWSADRPDFFFEGAIVVSEDKTSATVRPLLAVMNDAQGSRLFGKRGRSVATFFAFSLPGTSPNLPTNPAATVVLGEMIPGQARRYPAEMGVVETTTPYESPWFTLTDADAKKPLTVTAMISETQSGSPFLAFLGSVFNDEKVKGAITEKANYIFVPGAATAAKDEQVNVQRTAADTADTKLADAIAKLAACVGAGKDALSKGPDAKSALRAYLTADAALPTPAKKIIDRDVDAINLYDPASVATQCNNVYEKLTGKRL